MIKTIEAVGSIEDGTPISIPTYMREYKSHQGPQLYTYSTSIYKVMHTHVFDESKQKWIFNRIRDSDGNIIDES